MSEPLGEMLEGICDTLKDPLINECQIYSYNGVIVEEPNSCNNLKGDVSNGN